MTLRFEYRTIRVERGAWPQVIEAVHGPIADEVRAADGDLIGLWRGEIGWYSDQGVVMTSWTLGAVPSDTSIERMPNLDYALVQLLEPTVRPLHPDPLVENGVYAHRWFEVEPRHEAEFIDLSSSAWPDFEAAFPGVRVVGLWRELGAEDGASRLLLITRYPSLKAWEQSRPYNPALVPDAHAAREKFRRRAELTLRTIVRIGRLTSPS